MNKTADSTTTTVTQDKRPLETLTIKQHSYSEDDVRKDDTNISEAEGGEIKTCLVPLGIPTLHL